jgi:hypothetical protein
MALMRKLAGGVPAPAVAAPTAPPERRVIAPAVAASAPQAATQTAPEAGPAPEGGRRRIVRQLGAAGVAAHPANHVPAAPAAPADTSGDWMATGDAALVAAAAADAAADARRALTADRVFANRYRLGSPGSRTANEGEVIVLDVSTGPCFHEHNLKNPQTGFWDLHVSCPADVGEHCVLCEGGGAHEATIPPYVMALTVLNISGYTKRDGSRVAQSKELLISKQVVRPELWKIYERLKAEGKSFRGAHLLMTRHAERDERVGMPAYVDWYDEATLVENFGHDARMKIDKPLEVHQPENYDITAFDYGRLFPRPSGDAVRNQFGGAAPFGGGNASANREPFAGTSGANGGWGGDTTPGRFGGGAAAAPAGAVFGGGGGADLDDEIPF